MVIPGPKRRRLVIWSRALWVPGLVVAAASFGYNWFIVPHTDDGYGPPLAAFPFNAGTIFFVVGMLILVAGLVLRRVAARPSGAQHAVWVAAGIGWCGVLLFGIGCAGSNFYDDWGFGGGAVVATMIFVGAFVVLIALLVFLFSRLYMRTISPPASHARDGDLR